MWTVERVLRFDIDPNREEIENRMHTDLLALRGLSIQLPRLFGASVIVEKGYAIEAATAGKITRTHYDTDILVALPTKEYTDDFIDMVLKILEDYTNIKWVATHQKRKSWLKFHEKGKRQWDDGITGTPSDLELAHQIDCHIVYSPEPFKHTDKILLVSGTGDEYEKPIQTDTLTDTTGEIFSLIIPTIEDIAATKLRLIDSFSEFYGMSLRESDYYDFEKIFSTKDFRIDTFLELLSEYYDQRGVGKSERGELVNRSLSPLATTIPQAVYERIIEYFQ